jgi:tetratricopeptide (TPR) repeat protein
MEIHTARRRGAKVGLEREIKELKAIALLYRRRNRFALSLDILNAALDIEQSLYGTQSQQVALTLYQIGETLCDLSRYDEARSYFGRAVQIWQVLNPHDTESMLGYSNALTKLQEQATREDEAEQQSGVISREVDSDAA